MNSRFYRVDEFGVRNYKSRYLALLSISSLYLVISLFSVLLLHFETGVNGANITNYADAFWTLQMSASTIGFGDHYPISFGGRMIVTLMFYIGVGLVGFIGAIVAERVFGFADTSIKNRELRQQNAQILAYNQSLDKKLDVLIKQMESTEK
ncbi:MAG: two pore domain potassium channel family protein [Gammaproteobacteria bacterium]|nr:two pore domain potassium channel family protein [Gammaproteobacteria bacterium]